MNTFQKSAVLVTLCLVVAVSVTSFWEVRKQQCVLSVSEADSKVATDIDYSKYNW